METKIPTIMANLSQPVNKRVQEIASIQKFPKHIYPIQAEHQKQFRPDSQQDKGGKT